MPENEYLFLDRGRGHNDMLNHVLSEVRQILEEARLDLSSDIAASIEKLFKDIETLINFINREIVIIDNSKNLNESEKRTARREVLENAGRKLEVIKTRGIFATLAEELESKLLEMSDPENDENRLLKFLREREIRDRLFGMTEAQIHSHFGDSLYDGNNLLLLDAILNAPQGFELFPESILKKLRWIRAVKLNPEVASELEMARELNLVSKKMLNLVKKELDSSRLKEIKL
jgi:hypothetical protein